MRTKTFLYTLVAFGLGFGAACVLHSPRIITVTETHTDTIRVVQPEIMVVHPRVRTVRRTLPAVPDTAHTAVADSVQVEVPISSTEYAGDGYRAWVSGYEAHLDSIVTTRSITTMQALPKISNTPQRRISLSLQAGYGITPKGPQPYLGIGLSWRIF